MKPLAKIIPLGFILTVVFAFIGALSCTKGLWFVGVMFIIASIGSLYVTAHSLVKFIKDELK